MLRLILVVALGCALERDERLGSRSPLSFWLTIAVLVIVSTSLPV